MKKFGKVVRIIGLVIGVFLFSGMLSMLINPSGRESIFKGSPLPEFVIFIIIIALMGLGLFLIVYNILCLKKGIDIFFWKIFKREAYRNGDYKKPKTKPTSSSSSSSSYSSTPRPSSPKPTQPTRTYECSWSDIQTAVEGVEKTQIWGFNAYVKVDSVVVEETGREYTFRIDVTFKAFGSATIRDEVDANKFKSGAQSAIEAMCRRVNEKVDSLHQRYGFGYFTEFGDVKDEVNYLDY